MKNIIFFLSTVLFLAGFYSPAQVARSYDLETFSLIRIEGPYSVKALFGTPRVQLDGDIDVIEKTSVKIVRGELIISYEGGRWGGISERVEVTIEFEKLDGISAQGACKVAVKDRIESDNFDIDVSGASEIEMSLDVSELRVDLSGASSVFISGRTDRQEIDMSGASKMNAGDLLSSHCNIECSGASTALIAVEDRLRAEASGASSVRYYGNPGYINSNSSGAASIRKKNN